TAILRREQRRGPGRWRGCARAIAGTPVERDRPRPPAGVPLRRHDRGQPALRQRASHGRRALACPRGGPGARLRRDHAWRPRRADRPGRHQRVRRAASAARDRPRCGEATGGLSVRRLLLCSRRRHRREAARRASGRDRAVDRSDRRPTRQHDHARRPDHRPGRRPGRRHGHARRSDGHMRALSGDRRFPARRGGGRMINRPGGGGPGQGVQRRQPGGWMGGMAGPPPAKVSNPRQTLGKLLARLRPELPLIVFVTLLGIGSVAFSVIGPKIIGSATDIIFNGIVGKMLPAGLTKAQAIALLQAHGQGQIAQMLSGMNVTPGKGIDFNALGMILLLAAAVYIFSSVLMWAQGYILAGVAQRTVFALRRDVDAKLARLPLKYFDSHSHGDILSRVTNDIDNITTTLQQGLGQILTSVLTVVGVLAFMIWISPLLALIALVTVPLSVVVTLLIARRSQKQFAAQWKWTGSLNGHVEEMHTGHALVQVFGRRASAQKVFEEHNGRLFEASFKAQFLSGIIQPAIQFLANLNYVAVAVIGAYRVASGTMTLGDVQAFIQYSRQFTMPIMQIAGQMNLLQSGLASAERVFE